MSRVLRVAGVRRGTVGAVWTFVAVAVLVAAALSRPAAAARAIPQQGDTGLLEVTVVVEPETASVVLGDDLDLQITLANDGGAATPPLVLHLDILDRNGEGSVDPEDWTTTLTRSIAEIPAGGSTDISWTVQPISAGTFVAYAVAVERSGAALSASGLSEVIVEDQRSLNPGNILPLSIGAPLLVGAALVVQLRLGRRSGRRGRTISADRPQGAST